MCASYSERTQVLLSVDQRRRLERIAKHEGKSVGAGIREAIERFASDSSSAETDDLETIFSLGLPVGQWSEMKADHWLSNEVTVLVDAAVFMYAAGRDHSLQEPARNVLRETQAGRLDAVVSAEVIQEILHRFTGIQGHSDGVALAEAALHMFRPVLSLDHGVMHRTADLARRHPTARARDLVHVATCLAYDLEAIVSPDEDFDGIGEVRRIPVGDVTGRQPY